MRRILSGSLVLLAFLLGCSRETPQSSRREAPASTEDWLTAGRRARAQSPHPIDQLDIDHLKELGLRDPVRDLITDLQRHPEVLPFQPPRGASRFGFYDSTQIRVLTGDWVYAYTEDGHVARPVLLKYKVGEGGRIEWKVIAVDRYYE